MTNDQKIVDAINSVTGEGLELYVYTSFERDRVAKVMLELSRIATATTAQLAKQYPELLGGLND